MGFFEDLEKSRPVYSLVYVIITISFFLPGIGHLYFFHLELFKELEVLKLILISILFSLPLFLINLFSVFLAEGANKLIKRDKGIESKEDEDEDEDVRFLSILVVTGLITLLYFFFGLFSGFLLSNYGSGNFETISRNFTYSLSFVTFFFFAFSFLTIHKKTKKI